jgi:cytochrome c
LTANWAPANEVKLEHPGAKVYQQMCADCHGAKGEGVADKYDEPLVGNRSVPSLIRYISRAMPDGKEGTCVG